METTLSHYPVLLDEVLEGLNIQADGIYLDGTFGRGGHAAEILNRLGPNGRLIAVDKDPQAVRVAQDRFGDDPRFHIEQGTFVMLGQLIKDLGLAGKINGVLLDLGVSSPQLDDPERGFSFMQDGPLDMRMDPDSGMSAADWLAVASVTEMTHVFKTYGEERFGKRIAHAVDETREETPILRTLQFSKLISEAMPVHDRHKHPATRTFQAIRIFINQELDDISQALEGLMDVLASGGRVVVISFHSLEDRIVKRFMRKESKGKPIPHGLPVMGGPEGIRLRLCGKAIRASAQELAENPRSRSAILRVAECVV
ncbi:MAG: 16S rRNA (cytosine(1402)-N(4))-methyltransferase RsmH [Gammaproteobacteria bacterium]|nr:16S rRNA (cytosine(1402)-N(4))-methyltransferase RsmH [Gammaproteobacteria bacterium]